MSVNESVLWSRGGPKVDEENSCRECGPKWKESMSLSLYKRRSYIPGRDLKGGLAGSGNKTGGKKSSPLKKKGKSFCCYSSLKI